MGKHGIGSIKGFDGTELFIERVEHTYTYVYTHGIYFYWSRFDYEKESCMHGCLLGMRALERRLRVPIYQ